jgi:hypothetical protein
MKVNLTRYLMDTIPDTLPICKARSKQSGQRCKNFASRGKQVCRIHGGRSMGARTQQGKQRQKMASRKHGRRSSEAIEEKQRICGLIKTAKTLISI